MTRTLLGACIFLSIRRGGYGDPNPDHYFLAMNYRLSELQGAVALASVAEGWEGGSTTPCRLGTVLEQELAGLKGVQIP